jgi:endo-1,4-beta-xylanase
MPPAKPPTLLPNPLLFSDGATVASPADWPRRREELKTLFADCEYGPLPPRPDNFHIEWDDAIEDEGFAALVKMGSLMVEYGSNRLAIPVRLLLPRGAGGAVPVVIQPWFGRGWPRKAEFDGFLSIFPRRGYALAEFDYQEIVRDDAQQATTSGLYRLFDGYGDCGALMGWAWGFHCMLDLLETMSEVDAGKNIATGHSRLGKAALVAGAFDERIAITVPSHSGCAGAAPYRLLFGNSEQLHNIVGFAPHWFRPDFNQFVGKVDELPLDQHLLMALIAPRPLLMSEGTEDAWTNPQGVQHAYLAARPVYEFLGAGEQISICYRPIEHIPTPEDLLDFADHHFFGKPLPDEFGELVYPPSV